MPSETAGLTRMGLKARLQYKDDKAIPSEPAIKYPQTRGI